MNERELLAQKADKAEELRKLNALAETENRDLSADEQTRWDALKGEIETLDKRIERQRSLPVVEPQRPAPAVLKYARGDSFESGLAAYLRKGDLGGVAEFRDGETGGIEVRASNATDMNITTAADGGYVVPTGLYNQVIAKRSEIALHERLGVRRIPGVGTTVNVPYDNETDGEFVATNEAAAYDLDAPALGQAAMTLVNYSKYIKLSMQLLNDEDASLMAFLADWAARGQAKTMNSLLLTEVAANGTQFKETAASAAIAAGEVEGVYMNDYVSDYLDDTGSVGWVMRASVYGTIIGLTGNSRLYLPQVQGDKSPRNLLGEPVFFSTKSAAIAASAKTAYFGNWNYVGVRESPGFTLLRDPYSAASTGQIVLWMHFRTVFKVLQPYAIGYLQQKAS